MDEERALAQLQALLTVPGALKIKTNEIRPDLREDAKNPRSGLRPDVSELDPFVYHDVVALDALQDGFYRVRSAEGDTVTGLPSALLRRLM